GESNAVDAAVELSQRECDKDSNVADFSSQTEILLPIDRLATEGKGLLPTSETIKPFNMSSRCSAVDNMGMVNRDVEADDELKSCSCSFCRKVFV
ncbi:hypothetical protein HID58_053669, partial [Brassica napus]